MDAFYASVEQRDNPEFKGRPVVVGGPSRRGVVAAASYEARRFGIHSAMPTAKAMRLCAELVLVRPRIKQYAAVSSQIFKIFKSYTPLVEPLSLDEAFLDLTGAERLFGTPMDVARAIKERVRQELDLVVSVGVGPSKFVAKIASDLGKPDGLVEVAPGEVLSFLHPLPVSRLFGVGKVTERKLSAMGIATIGDLAALPEDQVLPHLGAAGQQLWSLARGEDEREVIVDREPESIGHEDTFSRDKEDPEELGEIIQEQADRVARRLRAQGYQAKIIVVKVKSAKFKVRSRRKSLPRPTSDANLMGQVARGLLATAMKGLGPLRLIGVTAAGLVDAEETQQLTFEDQDPTAQEGERLGQALDQITSKFGEGILVRGTALKGKEPAE